MTAHPPRALRQSLACLLASLALPAGAIGLGELRVQSALGEPLDATVALTPSAGVAPRPDCFSLGRAREGGLPVVAGAVFAVEPDGAGWRVRIQTRRNVVEPALLLRLNASCEGKEVASRDYPILLDPLPAREPPPAFASLPGDTLASLAAAIYPRRPAVREAYVQALRKANPALAAFAPEDPVPPGTQLVLPDLRLFSLSLAVTPAAPRPGLPVVAPKAPVEPPPAAARAQAQKGPPPVPAPAAPAQAQEAPSPAKPPEAPRPTAAVPPKPAPATKPAAAREASAPARSPALRADGQFVLRLSSPEVDLSRSRGVDDRMRMQLRERLLVLDADDQVSALLAMRNSLKQLEGRVAELQLKLSTLSTAPAVKPAEPKAAPAPAAVTPPAVKPDPAPAPAAITPPAVKPEPVPAATTPTPAPVARPEPAEPPVSIAKAPAAQPPAPGKPSGMLGQPWWLWGVAALVVAGVAAFAWRALAPPRRKIVAPAAAAAGAADDLAGAEAMMRGGTENRGAAAASAPSREHRVVAESDAGLTTTVPGGDPAALRIRYIEERFPEIASGTIVLGDMESLLKAARLFYEDGALARAVELLQFAVEEDPAALKPWLALFEIFRLEGLTGEFGELAARFRMHHGSSDYWQKVQHIGRDLDPKDPLYRETSTGSLETVGDPRGKPGTGITFDPLTENWLNAPMDFTTVALAARLRSGILSDAGVSDSDLVANPMPALKSIEMFDVA